MQKAILAQTLKSLRGEQEAEYYRWRYVCGFVFVAACVRVCMHRGGKGGGGGNKSLQPPPTHSPTRQVEFSLGLKLRAGVTASARVTGGFRARDRARARAGRRAADTAARVEVGKVVIGGFRTRARVRARARIRVRVGARARVRIGAKARVVARVRIRARARTGPRGAAGTRIRRSRDGSCSAAR